MGRFRLVRVSTKHVVYGSFIFKKPIIIILLQLAAKELTVLKPEIDCDKMAMGFDVSLLQYFS
jgi:hypothetical protein